MKLIPVLELEPSLYAKQHREIPESSERDAWHSYWKESLADSGIENLEPYEHSSWLVPLDSILEPQIIAAVLNQHLGLTNTRSQDTSLSLDERISPLPGGYILEIDENTKIRPQCCGTLEDLHNWKHALQSSGADEQTLWIGHPWLMVSSVANEHLRLRETVEYGEPIDLIDIQVEKKNLEQAIQWAEAKLIDFGNRLRPVLKDFFPHEYEQALEILIKGRY